ncbi:phosphotransferase [Deinococcus peraridilitoris]|nr:phosphotransferase [Deinococcus peraridilitoris]
MRVKLMLVRHGEAHAVTLGSWAPENQEFTPAALRRQVLHLTGIDTILLHDGGLSLGIHAGPVVMESLGAWPSLPGWQLDEVCAVPNARPWQRAGWFAEVRAWMDAVLAQHNETRLGEVEQVSTYDFACVLRAATSGGVVYFKAVYRGREAAVTREVLLRWPAGLPEILATDPARGWLLSRDGGRRLHEEANFEIWVEAAEGLARAHRILDAPALGCPVVALQELPVQADALFRDAEGLRDAGLSAEQVTQLVRLLPRLEQARRRLAVLKLELTACHGDAHPMNALYGPRGAVWFDWNEAHVGHPLLDAGWFLAWLMHPARHTLPVRQAYPDSGLALWRAFLQASRIRGAEYLLGDAVLLAVLMRALRFHEHARVFAGTVPGWRPQGVSYFLRWLLREAS